MPKRVAEDQLLLFQKRKKAKFTAAGKPICDRCYKVVYNNQNSEVVNDRHRHWECWPSYMAANRVWREATWDSRPVLPMREYKKFFRATLDEFNSTVQQLKDKEYIMKQINCVSKGVREALQVAAAAVARRYSLQVAA